MLKNIEQALDLTRKIKLSAEREEWDKVANLQENREALMLSTQQLSVPCDEKSSLEIERLISEMQKIDTQVLPIIAKHMRTLSQEQQQTNQGKKMTKAYQST
jgi:hypothetical protein